MVSTAKHLGLWQGMWDQMLPQRAGLEDGFKNHLFWYGPHSTIRQSSEALVVWAGPSF